MSTGTVSPTVTEIAVARLDAWLDTMRGPDGYGGPVAHWWQQSLVYTGAGRDWRYEGIIVGYLQLWQRTGDARWLQKARRAGDDLVTGQLENGHYAASAFEINPATAGTPHEAAADVGLLQLARALRDAGHAGWEGYRSAAERNLCRFSLGQLWDEEVRCVRDSPAGAAFVPNKAATVCDALFLLAEITGEARWVERYARPTLDRILAHQVPGQGPLAGAIAQNSFGERRVEKYFPIYIARCVPALLTGYRWTDDGRYLDGALRAIRSIARWADPDGSFPTVIYPDRRVSRHPTWIAPLGDILRAMEAVRPFGCDIDPSSTTGYLLAGQDASGGIQTARGFAARAGGRLPTVPDVRDVLHVVGWCDKAFRYLSGQVGSTVPAAVSGTFETQCRFRGQDLWLLETPEMLQIESKGGSAVYRWRKGTPWPEVAAPAFWLR